MFALLQAEEEVEELRRLRAELETKEQEEDARSIFLHFTQEQLNSQVRRSSVTGEQKLNSQVRRLRAELDPR
jgi:hypothetical protein